MIGSNGKEGGNMKRTHHMISNGKKTGKNYSGRMVMVGGGLLGNIFITVKVQNMNTQKTNGQFIPIPRHPLGESESNAIEYSSELPILFPYIYTKKSFNGFYGVFMGSVFCGFFEKIVK